MAFASPQIRSSLRDLSRRVRHVVSWSHVWRLVLIFVMCCLSVFGMWAGIVSPAVARAAALKREPAPVVQNQPKAPRRGSRRASYASSISACPALTNTPKVVGNVDGLGTLGYYTFVKQNLDDRLLMETNVANGNLVLQDNVLQITGTGLNLNITLTYNSQSSASGILGSNWNLSVGNGVSLSFNNGNATFHGPSGFSAPYTKDSSSYDGYDEPAGMDATLVQSSVNGASYVLIYQKTNECLGFNSSGQEIFDQDKNGHQITFAYNGSGNLSSITDTQNRVTTFGYNANNQLNLITDPIGRTVQLAYTNGVPTTITDLNGKSTTLAYSGVNLTGITDPDTYTTNVYYQTGNSRVDHITDALGYTSYYAYYSPGASQCTSQIPSSEPCTTFKDANSHTTIYGYDDLEVQQVIDANGNLEQTSYTPDANVKTYTDPLNEVTTFGFDSSTNNLTSIKDGTQATTTYDYANTNPYLPTKATDAQGNSLSYTYDSNGNLLSATDSTSGGTGSSASYTYNTSGVSYGSYTYGLLTSVKDGDGNTTSYGYDSYGNLQTITPPSPLGQESITVDGVSRVSTVTDGNGVTLTYSYDNLDRITKLTYTQNGNSSSISYSYNDDGDQTSVQDNTGTTTFSYDHDNRLLTKTLPNSQQLTVSYDAVGNVHTYTDSGGTVSYSYDAANRLTQVKEPDGSNTTYGYNTANEKTSISYPNDTGELFGYDAAGHVTSAKAGKMSNGSITTTYASFTYTYTKGSTPTDLIQTVTLLDPVGHSATYTRDYSYDTMNRLTNAEVYNSSNQEVQDWSYSYDKAGNRTQSYLLSSGATTTYSYNAAEELTKTVQGSTTVTYSYDSDGNLTGSSNSQSYSYNTKNQTTAIDGNSYTYSGPDQTERVQINSTTDAYSGLGLSYETTSGSTTYYTRCSCGKLVDERLPSGNKYYYLFDGQDSVVGLTDSNGNEVNAYDYDPYGVILNETQGQANPFQYEGGYFESSTGLVKFGTRYYNPQLGRWTQQDPKLGNLSNPDNLNRYLYVTDDPINQVDPSGRLSKTDLLIACIVGGLTALGGVYLAALAPVILATGPAGAVTLGAAILAILTGCLLGELTYNLTQLFTGGF